MDSSGAPGPRSPPRVPPPVGSPGALGRPRPFPLIVPSFLNRPSWGSIGSLLKVLRVLLKVLISLFKVLRVLLKMLISFFKVLRVLLKVLLS